VATIRWTIRARLDLRAAHDFVARTSPERATALAENLVSATETLADFPRLGRTVPEFPGRGLREMLVPPYRVIYMVLDGGDVEIQALFHSSRDLRRALSADPLL
jgi:toxin ParE1/3/4